MRIGSDIYLIKSLLSLLHSQQIAKEQRSQKSNASCQELTRWHLSLHSLSGMSIAAPYLRASTSCSSVVRCSTAFPPSGFGTENEPHIRGVGGVMPPILLYWSTKSEVDVGGTAVEVEPSHQYLLSVFAMWQMAGEWQSVIMAFGMEVCMMQRCFTEFLHVEKNGTQRHSSVLAECLWRPGSGCEHSEVVGAAFQQWQEQ